MKRLTGHTVVRDVMGYKLLEHPLSCVVAAVDCPVQHALNRFDVHRSVPGKKGRGTWLVEMMVDGSVTLWPLDKAEMCSDEIGVLLDAYVTEVGRDAALDSMKNWLLGIRGT